MDGCADNPRTAAATDNDNLLNTYVDQIYGPGYYTLDQQLDYPMAVLLRESTGRFFSLAFVAGKRRGNDPTERANDTSEGFFDLGEVSNGDQNPITGESDIVPWQPVPRPTLVRLDCPVGSADVTAHLEWDDIRMVSDQSIRPSSRGLQNPGGGVGVLDQGVLCRYQLQQAMTISPNPDPATLDWSNVGPEIACGSGAGAPISTAVVTREGMALRIRTMLGKRPRVFSTLVADVRAGASGDLGYEATQCDGASNATCPVSPPFIIIQSCLVSEQAVDTVAVRNRNAILVTFRTTSELTVTGIDILGRGGAVLRSLSPKNGTTGIGAFYEVLLAPGELKGAKELRVRLNGPETVSDPFPVQ